MAGSLLITDKDIQRPLDGLDINRVALAISLPADHATKDILDREVLALHLDIPNDAAGVDRALEVGRVGDELVARDGGVGRPEKALGSNGIDEDAGIAVCDAGSQLGARLGVLEVDTDVDASLGNVDFRRVVHAEAALEVAVAEVHFRRPLAARADLRDVEGDVALRHIDVSDVPRLRQRTTECAFGDAECRGVGVYWPGLDEALGNSDGERSDLE